MAAGFVPGAGPLTSGQNRKQRSSQCRTVRSDRNFVARIRRTDELQVLKTMASDDENVLVVKVYADYCSSCQKIASKFKKFVGMFPRMNFYELNFEENKSFCEDLGVERLPHFYVYNGRTDESESVTCTWTQAGKLRDMLMRHCP